MQQSTKTFSARNANPVIYTPVCDLWEVYFKNNFKAQCEIWATELAQLLS